MSSDKTVPITPGLKVAALLDEYPELEPVLVELAPAFKKLRNPVLRKTVARVTTLERAAGIAGLDTAVLVRALRKAAGQAVDDAEMSISLLERHECGCSPPPEQGIDDGAWFDESRVRETIDADTMLAAGEVPLGKVLRRSRALSAGDILRVTIEFKPLPLIETLQQQGFRTFCRQRNGGHYELFVSLDGSA
jgi:hypothetical protein